MVGKRHSHVLIAGTLLLIAALAAPSLAQAQLATYYQVQTVQVKPEHLADYEAAVVDLMKWYEKYGHNRAIQARAGMNDMTISYITAFESLAEIEASDAEFEKLLEKGGDEYRRIAQKFQKASISSRIELFKTRLDLSHLPDDAQPAMAPDDFRQVGYWYVQRDKVEQAEANAKAYAELFRKRGVKRPFVILESYFGETPLYISVNPGTNAADFYAGAAKLNSMLGSEGQQMNLRALSATSNWESRDTVGRPDLSYTP